MPWDRLHELDPPFVPMIRSADDTQYFNDEEEPVTDLSDTENDEEDEELPEPETSSPGPNNRAETGQDGADDAIPKAPLIPNPASTIVNNIELLTPPASKSGSPTRQEAHAVTLASTIVATSGNRKRVGRDAHVAEALDGFDRSIQQAVHSWLAVPYDSIRLRNFELQVDAEPGLRVSERDALKGLVRMYGRKEKKRPRDRLLRDPATKKAVLAERKKTAFLGYDWQRIKEPCFFSVPMAAMGSAETVMEQPPAGLSTSATMGTGVGERRNGGGLWPYPPPGHEHLAALHRGRLSMN